MVNSIYILALYLSVLGFSHFIKKIFFKNIQNKETSFDLVFGLIFLYFISLLINFFFPLKYFSVFIFLIGIFSSLFYFKYTIKNINFFLLLIIFSVGIIIEPNSIAADTHFYHLQIIKWYSNEKAVFGLANLENRFGLVSGWHHLISMFNINIFKTNLLFLINTLPFIILSKEVFRLKNTVKLSLSEIFLYSVFLFLIFYAIIHPVLNGTIFNTMGSADADSAGNYFFISSFYFFLKFLEKQKENYFLYLITLVNLSYIAKISNVILILLPLFLIIFYRINLNKIKKYIIFLIFLNLLWISKILISTGCLAFPASYTCLSLEWSIPKKIVINFFNESSSFPRSKNNFEVNYNNYEYYIDSYKWFKNWFINYFIGISFIQICFLILVFSILFLFKQLITNFFFLKKKLVIFFIFFFTLNIYYWLIAPDIRYAYGFFICLTFLIFGCAVRIKFEFVNNLISHKNKLFFLLLVILVLKNAKYQLLEDYFNNNRQFNYANLSFYKKINNYDLYITNDGNCAFFKEICVYKKSDYLNIYRNSGYLFITNKQ